MVEWAWNVDFSNGEEKKEWLILLNMFMGDFQSVGTAPYKARVPAWGLTLETDNNWDAWSSLGLGARESMQNRYEGSPEERVWYAMA